MLRTKTPQQDQHEKWVLSALSGGGKTRFYFKGNRMASELAVINWS